ncbi:MAG: hypothetical protein AAGB00_03030 [Planctomycetota bacterium]
MTRTLTRAALLAAAIAASPFATTADAASMAPATEFGLGDQPTLAELEDCLGVIVIGDKEFTDFTYTPGVNAPASDQIVVEGYQDSDGEIGLIFNVGFFAGVVGPDVINASLRFTVNILDPLFVFDSATLTTTGTVPTLAGNSGVLGIEEVLVGEPGSGQYLLQTENNVLNGVQGPVSNFDEVFFPQSTAFTSLTVTKDIGVAAGEFNGTGMDPPDDFDRARLTTFTQGFNQRVIPEPTAVALLGMAVSVGLAFQRRR